MGVYLLHHLLTRSAEKHPDRTALIHGERTLTYAELDQQSGRLATLLVQTGVRPGDRVGILVKKSPESVVAIFGILKAGGVYVPLDPQAPPQRQGLVLSGCDISVLVASSALAGQLLAMPEGGVGVKSAVLTDGSLPKETPWRTLAWEEVALAPEAPPVEISDTRPAYILHTSGSTGVPKGVTISHSNALAFVDMAADFFDVGVDDRVAGHAPFHFDLSVFDLFTAVRNGATLVLVPENLGPFPARLTQFIETSGITIWNSVASVVALMAERGNLGDRNFDALRLVLFSGDVLPVKHLRRVREMMPKTDVYNLYGQTEANSSTFYQVGEIPDDECWKIPIGRPFPNFEVFALNEKGEAVRRPGEIGELHVCSATVALGYWRDTEKTATSFVENPLRPWPGRVYRTGDLVTFDEDGNLLILGRRDRQVKSRGYRIQIDEIDLVLNSHPEVREATVVDISDEVLGSRILAFVQAGNLSGLDLLDFCSRSLPPYMLPETIHFLEEFPRTATGKVDRNVLRTMKVGM